MDFIISLLPSQLHVPARTGGRSLRKAYESFLFEEGYFYNKIFASERLKFDIGKYGYLCTTTLVKKLADTLDSPYSSIIFDIYEYILDIENLLNKEDTTIWDVYRFVHIIDYVTEIVNSENPPAMLMMKTLWNTSLIPFVMYVSSLMPKIIAIRRKYVPLYLRYTLYSHYDTCTEGDCHICERYITRINYFTTNCKDCITWNQVDLLSIYLPREISIYIVSFIPNITVCEQCSCGYSK